MQNFTEQTHTLGLYDPQFEHDACGIGAVVDIKGRKSHQTVDDALRIVERLEHRAGKDAEGKTGDGVGMVDDLSVGLFFHGERVCTAVVPDFQRFAGGRALLLDLFPAAERAIVGNRIIHKTHLLSVSV